MVPLLLCALSTALPLFIRAEECQDISRWNETASVSQPFAFNCTYPPLTSGKAHVTWYKYPDKVPVIKNRQYRVHQDQHWILFLPLAWKDSGIYQCVIKNTNTCHRIHVNLTVLEKHWCNTSGNSPGASSDEYRQTLHVGKDGSLLCPLNFPKSCAVGAVKWYKDCKEIRGERFTSWELKLSVNNVSAEDRGSYACEATLTHEGRSFTVFNRIAVTVTENVGHGRRVPEITYPTNNTVEAHLGAPLVVNCTITDVRGNTNLRCWRVGSTLVDTYFEESGRVREGEEIYVSLQGHNFYTVNITFLEVKMEDYGLPFTCHAGVSAAYFILKPSVSDFRAHLVGGLLALAGAAVLVTCFYHMFRIDAVLWYRSAFRSTGVPGDGKLYDAYVLYPKPPHGGQNYKVDTLVLEVLPEVLEKQCGYKLFIFGRDEFPGQAMADVIDENVKLCRRLIIVVPESPGFGLLKNTSEEQMAVHNALIQDGMKVILIEVGEVGNYTAMPESIQYIRRKHGSVRWPGGFPGEAPCAKTKFWKKVRYHMPPKRFPPAPSAQSLERTPCDHRAGTCEAHAGQDAPYVGQSA